MRPKDYLLIVVLYGSLLLGICLPEYSRYAAPVLKYLMMVMLFLAFINIAPDDVWHSLRKNPLNIIAGAAVRLIGAPIAVYGVTRLVYPEIALPMLLLAGVSTGVSAPFFTGLCRGNISFTLVMALLTSLLVPFSLPLMVRLLAGTTLNYNLTAMALFLALVIFIPLTAAFALRAYLPGALDQINRIAFPVSLVVLAVINFGALGHYLPYLKANSAQITGAVICSSLMAVAMAGLGWSTAWGRGWSEQVASAGSQVWLNNVLIIVLAVHLNDSTAAVIGAFYFVPLYAFVVFYHFLSGRQDVLSR